MRHIFLTFIKRVPREGFKSLTVPVLALVLVVLISITYGARINLTADLEYVIDNFTVRVEVSHPVTAEMHHLGVSMHYIRLFTDTAATPTLADWLKDTELNRTLEIYHDLPGPGPQWVGITSVAADARLDPVTGAFIDFFPGYDENIFRTNEPVAVVSASRFGTLDADSLPSDSEPAFAYFVSLTLQNRFLVPAGEDDYGEAVYEEVMYETERTLRIVGIAHRAGNAVFSPFWTVNEAAEELGLPLYSNRMSAVIYDNRTIGEFAHAAARHFARAGDLEAELPLALTIFDATYNDVVRRLRQNIQLINISTPFIYALSVLIGFIASYVLTRRRKPEFALMRSIGVNKRDVFIGALGEQAALCAVGAAVGFAAFGVFYGSFIALPPVLFTLCYILGCVFAAIRAAGTNVLKILREKE